MKLACAKEIRELDRIAIEEYRIPGLILMENAGAGTVNAMIEHFGDLTGRTVAVVAGPGNNGGDGLVIARHILQRGGLPLVFMLVKPKKLKGDAAVNLEIVSQLEIPFFVIDDLEHISSLSNCLPDCDLVVDAIFGTGLTRKPAAHFALAIETINTACCPVVSVDLPSGLNSDTGRPVGVTVQSSLTATYGLAKPGLFLGSGPEYAGTLAVIDICLPPGAIAEANLQTELLEEELVRNWLPSRPVTAHKGTFGHLLVLAGSVGMSGAALLCARGALRSGAGLVSVATPSSIQPVIANALPEAMTVILPSCPDRLDVADFDLVMAAARGKSAVVIGPGLGQDKNTGKLIAALYQKLELPVLLDADGINLLARQGIDLRNTPAPRILTPHPGEMSRITGLGVDKIQADRLGTAREFAVQNNLFLVLKGNGTTIASPEGYLAINSTGNPLLAIGGSGDVLSGLIGGLLCQGLSAWESACSGVFIHGLAADFQYEKKGLFQGMLASELADEVAMVFAELLNEND